MTATEEAMKANEGQLLWMPQDELLCRLWNCCPWQGTNESKEEMNLQKSKCSDDSESNFNFGKLNDWTELGTTTGQSTHWNWSNNVRDEKGDNKLTANERTVSVTTDQSQTEKVSSLVITDKKWDGTYLLQDSLILGFFHDKVCFLLFFWLFGDDPAVVEVGVDGVDNNDDTGSEWCRPGSFRA